MKSKKLQDLAAVTDAAFQKQYQALRPLLEAEARIQQQLIRLDAQVQQARADSRDTDGYQVTGTDILWNGWESSARRQLNTELARVRAQKLAALDGLKTAFGRNQAVASLARAAQLERHAMRMKKLSQP